MKEVNIFWFRRDLRLEDNAALYHALKSGLPVVPVFIFDRNILNKLENKADRRVEFIFQSLCNIQGQLVTLGSSLEVYDGTPHDVYTLLLSKYAIRYVYANNDYEPYAAERDAGIQKLLQANGAALLTIKDQVIFEKDEVLKDDGRPYTVFTPYSKKWKAKLTPFHLKPYPVKKYSGGFYRQVAVALPRLESFGFVPSGLPFPPLYPGDQVISEYAKKRDFPGIENGTSHMGLHLRFGTVSIRALASRALQLNETFLNELIWREFYQMILWQFPHVGKGFSFKPAYDLIPWRNNEEEFARWCEGNTGYPIVDAGMRELNATGFMHNRVRMIVASFLSKHLLIDWRWGEAYFAEKLLDYDLAANNGGWQWASGSGCDSAPYFRVFNPTLQAQRFDKDGLYIKKWVPELDGFNYPAPMVVHEAARARVLEMYKKALNGQL